jgi:diguanylate cyclase (GGDEF)-like protein/PAS domain S-box-containing protein
MLRLVGCITRQHDLRLVALAACICALACLTTLNLVARARVSKRRQSLAYTVGAAAVFGCGVWSLHFVAMLAFTPGVPIAYRVSMTIVSILVTVIGAFLALLLWLFCASRFAGAVAAGSLLGITVSTMHYSGVLAMRVPGRIHFDRGEIVASVVISVAFGILALARFDALASTWRRLEAAGWLALSICGLHFTGMAALSIELGGPSSQKGAVLGSATLGVTVGIVSLAILIVSLAGTLMEQRLSQRTVVELTRMRRLTDMSHGILILYRDGIILLINAAGSRMFGVPTDELVGRQMVDFIAAADRATIMRRVDQREARLDHEEIHVETVTGTRIAVEFTCGETIDFEGKPAVMIALRDLSDRKRDEAKIRHLAHHDALTDLPNRFLLQERLDHALSMSARSGDPLALLFLDLDRFKPVNDLFGHAVGDALLIEVAKRLRSELRQADTLARVGGDEFVIVVALDRQEDAGILAGRLTDAVAQPFDLDVGPVDIGTSIGIAFYPADGNDQKALMHAADTALYRAKHEKRGTFRFFEPAMDEHLQARNQLERDLRLAVERGQLHVYYQPLVGCLSGEVEGFEALLRWHHPERGIIPPMEFIPVAEESGLIVKIGQWVLETACAAAARWTNPHWIAVNVSPVQFRQSDLPGIVAAALARSGLPAIRLELELTEGVLMEDAGRANKVLSALRQMGVTLALDDFGTGYSSLSYLHAFKFDKLKIDKSFVARLGETEDSSIIVRTIIGLAHNLGLSTVAEGVETLEQLAIIRGFMCDQAQGYLLGRPMEMDGSTELMAARMRMLFVDKVIPSIGPDIRLENDQSKSGVLLEGVALP